MHNPSHPGGLIADILENGDLSIGKSVSALARHIGVSRTSIARVMQGRGAVSAELALRLEEAVGVKADLWLRMQTQRDLWEAGRKKRPPVPNLLMSQAA